MNPSGGGVSDLLALEPFPSISAPGRLGVFTEFDYFSSTFITAHFVTFKTLPMYVPLKEKNSHCDHERRRPETIKMHPNFRDVKVFFCLFVF